MSTQNNKVIVAGKGIGFCGILFIILLLLKVGVVETTVTGWSWWIITMPLWGPTALVVGITVCFLIVMFVILALAAICGGIASLLEKK